MDKCVATSTRTGIRCARWPTRDHELCRSHGSPAAQVKTRRNVVASTELPGGVRVEVVVRCLPAHTGPKSRAPEPTSANIELGEN